METESLLKYETKKLLSSSSLLGKESSSPGSAMFSLSTEETQDRIGAKSPKLKKEPGVRESLSALLPPIKSVVDGEEWAQYVSTKPAIPQDVRKLEERLDRLLREQQARETGVCPIREKLYQQAFSEVIRQVSINSYDRGKLLVRIRDHSQLTIDTYKRLFESSVTFGMRKMLQANRRAESRRMKIEKSSEECLVLQREVQALEREVEGLDAQNEAQDAVLSCAHEKRKLHLLTLNQELTTRLENLLQATKR